MELKKSDIPYGYAYCFATDEQCARCAECLHSLITKLPIDKQDTGTLTAIDPRYIQTLTEKSPCTYFRSATPQIYARGMSGMFDDVPTRITPYVRAGVQRIMSCRTNYYLARRGKKLITPEQQERIAAVFRNLCPGIEPKYDGFEEHYSWYEDIS